MLHLNSSLRDAANPPAKADVPLDEACGNLGSCMELGELGETVEITHPSGYNTQLGVVAV